MQVSARARVTVGNLQRQGVKAPTIYYSPTVGIEQFAKALREAGYSCLPVTRAMDRLKSQPGQAVIFLLDAEALGSGAAQVVRGLNTMSSLVILVSSSSPVTSIAQSDVFLWLDRPLREASLRSAIASASEHLSLREALQSSESELLRRSLDMHELHKVGMALTLERDLDTLHQIILQKSRELTGADAGSLYLVEEDDQKNRRLRFKLAHNDSVHVPFQQFVMPISHGSIAGHVALSGEMLNVHDCYQLPEDLPFRFNQKFDQDTGYRSKSMLVVPMTNYVGEIVGVIQLINCKPDFDLKLATPDLAEREVIDFDEEAVELVRSFASQAAVALENRVLVENIGNLQEALEHSEVELRRRSMDMQELHKVGAALSSERDLDTLHQIILQKSRELTGADAGSLYLIVEDPKDKSKKLQFKLAHNDSVNVPFQAFVMPLSRESIAGYVATTGEVLNIHDAYVLPEEAGFRFNRKFDEDTGYRSKSMLVVPMTNYAGEIVGVIQLINCKRDFEARLTSSQIAEHEVIDFDQEAVELVKSFASQAAVAHENRMLVENMELLFKGFVEASVMAIEARDPTTSGHSQRVSKYTLGIARVLNRIEVGRFRDVFFTPAQLQEIEYAALLHDFGKIGVREHVLVKAKKLYDWDLKFLQDRFEIVRRMERERHATKQLDLLLREGRERFMELLPALNAELARDLAELEEALRLVLEVNEPTVLDEERFNQLKRITELMYDDDDGVRKPLVDAHEFKMLSIRRGTLDEDERREIESHVTHTYRFLQVIPWVAGLKNVPEIAWAHHEKLNGKGYPRGLTADAIPLQAKMMTIADIFDALTARDRPYKKAVPLTKALDILGFEAKDGNIDSELLQLFIENRVYEAADHLTDVARQGESQRALSVAS